jgi:hypothetical protein
VTLREVEIRMSKSFLRSAKWVMGGTQRRRGRRVTLMTAAVPVQTKTQTSPWRVQVSVYPTTWVQHKILAWFRILLRWEELREMNKKNRPQHGPLPTILHVFLDHWYYFAISQDTKRWDQWLGRVVRRGGNLDRFRHHQSSKPKSNMFIKRFKWN